MARITLNRVDYFQVGTTSAKTMNLLPTTSKETTNKIAVGDHSGVLHVFGVRKAVPDIVFRTDLQASNRIVRLELGGPENSKPDRIFIAAGTGVKGFARRGKQFLDFNTTLSEPIKSMSIESRHLVLTGNHVYQHCNNIVDTDYLLLQEKINDVMCLPLTTERRHLLSAVACSDHVIRVIKDSAIVSTFETAGSPQTLGRSPHTDCLLYGTGDGRLGMASLDHSEDNAISWRSDNVDRRGAVTCLDSFDIVGDGVVDVMVGRVDGIIELLRYDVDTGSLDLSFSYKCSESVTSLHGGYIARPDFPEVVCCTYAGWVAGLTSEPIQSAIGQQQNAVNTDNYMKVKITELKAELEVLEGQVAEQRSPSLNSDVTTSMTSFNVNDRCSLNRDSACYTLTVEVQSSIEYVLLQSDVELDLFEDTAERDVIISKTQCPVANSDGNRLLATYRCKPNTTHFDVKFRPVEGQNGLLHVYVSTDIIPKTCHVLQYQIRLLSLHQRTNEFDANRPYNVVHLTGQFSVAEIHGWLEQCLDELPQHPSSTDSTSTVYYVSTHLGTMLECVYRRGEAHFRSDNISTVAILKDVVTREATRSKIGVDIIGCTPNDDSIEHLLQLIDAQLDYQLGLGHKIKILEGLNELKSSESSVEYLSSEHQLLLADANRLRVEYSQQQRTVNRLHDVIVDLFVDMYKFKGIGVKSRIPGLRAMLSTRYSLQLVKGYFNDPTM